MEKAKRITKEVWNKSTSEYLDMCKQNMKKHCNSKKKLNQKNFVF